MRLESDLIYLRDTTLEDIPRRRYWELELNEWKQWDAPWEYQYLSEAELVADSERYLSSLASRIRHAPKDQTNELRQGFEIVTQADDRPIGWVNYYHIDVNYEWTPKTNAMGIAVGLVIPDLQDRGCGYGKAALKCYFKYFFDHGYHEVYVQTWSGNQAMVGLAQSLGLEEVNRKPRHRRVRGSNYDAITYCSYYY